MIKSISKLIDTNADWNTGILTDVVAVNDGLELENGYALSFDVIDDYVSIPNESSFEGMSYIEIEADIVGWNTSAADAMRIFDKYWDGTNRSYYLSITTTNFLEFNVSTNTVNVNTVAVYSLDGYDSTIPHTVKGSWSSVDNTIRPVSYTHLTLPTILLV